MVIRVVHLPAFSGAPGYRGAAIDELLEAALTDARRYARGGVHGLIVENHGDIPFAKPEDLGPETAAVMAVIADRVRRDVGLPLGINVLANNARHALAVAQAAGAGFVRVNQWANAYVANEGILEGPAAAATRYRAWLRAEAVRVFADVRVKHGAHAIVAEVLAQADGVIVASALKEDGVWWNAISAARVRAFMEVVSGFAAGG